MNFSKEKIINNDRYLHHFYCNHLNVELNRELAVRCTREKKTQTEERLLKIFKCINEPDNVDILFETIITNEKIKKMYEYMTNAEIKWFKNLISVSENMPICITVSSAMKKLYGFPLIYVNKRFEEMTQYTKNDILGKNCNFLQLDVIPENETIQYILMKNALENKSPISVVITNKKADGTLFQNLLSLVPIKNKNDNLLYVVGIQIELDVNKINFVDIQNVIDLVSIISYDADKIK